MLLAGIVFVVPKMLLESNLTAEGLCTYNAPGSGFGSHGSSSINRLVTEMSPEKKNKKERYKEMVVSQGPIGSKQRRISGKQEGLVANKEV